MSTAPEPCPGSQAAPNRFAGPITRVAIPGLIQTVCASRETGVLALRDGKIQKSAYVREGRLVFARSNDPDDRLGELFLRRGTLTVRGFERCTRKVATTGRRLGGILVDEGLITAQDLIEGVREQVRGIIQSMFLWTRGDYCFLMGALPTEEVITLRVHTGDLVRAGIGQVETWSRIREAVGGLDTAYQYEPRFDPQIQEMTLSRSEERLLQFLARPATVGEVCDTMNGNNFEVCRMIWAFLVMGALRRADATAAADVAAGS
ncbi:MAG: DUF4388 domain-containing protein [Acidobacteriota bacterium]|jgi:hypothetical protein